MYVTRRLSEYQTQSSDLTKLSPEGPNTGVLVIQDKESKSTCCFGACYNGKLEGLPFPQNVTLIVTYKPKLAWLLTICAVCAAAGDDGGGGPAGSMDETHPVLFIPVIDQPLSSNRYYVIKRDGRHRGALASAKEENRVSCCICLSYIPKVKPQEADSSDIYQQFQIHQRRKSHKYYNATSIAPDGKPPKFLRRKYWTLKYSSSEDLGLTDDANGINTKLRSELPNDVNTNVVVGKWYVPFIFVKERNTKDQLKNSTYYCMTLKQRWEEVYSCNYNGNGEVVVDVEVEREVVKLNEQGTKMSEAKDDGFVWFSILGEEVEDKKIGLGSVVVERMKWEEERFGWIKNGVRSKIKRSERFDQSGSTQWKRYRCYVLIESFELKRMDGSFLKYEFKHVDKLKSKWD